MRKDVNSLGHIISGLSDLLEGLSGLAEQGTELLDTVSTRNGRARASYGLSIGTVAGPRGGADGDGDGQRDPAPRQPLPRAATPVQEIFDEGDFVRTVIEVPGVVDGDIQFRVNGQEVTVDARRHDGRRVVRLRVPATVTAEGATSTYRNGMFEIVLPKRKGRRG